MTDDGPSWDTRDEDVDSLVADVSEILKEMRSS